MAAKAKLHCVDGQWTTVCEQAERLSVKPDTLYALMSYHKCGLQVAVDMLRTNQAGSGQGRARRHRVDGRYLTIRQAAEELGLKRVTLYNRMRERHMTLEQAIEYYKTGQNRHTGNPPKRHYVGKRRMTVREVAEYFGVRESSVRSYMNRHKCSLNAAYQHFDTRQSRRAQNDILRILGF